MAIAINGTGTITGITAGGLPDAIITQLELATGVAGTGPAFSVYSNADQTTTTNVWTKITFQVEDFDTNNNFASSRFTPTVSGYYQINGSYYSNGGPSRTAIATYKNGASYKVVDTVATTYGILISSLVYLNGSTDYVEIYMNNVTGGYGVLFDSTRTYFSGSMVRSA